MDITDIKVTFTCCRCGQKIPTWWNEGVLDGHFIAEGANFSEVFDEWLPDPQMIICGACTTEKP